VHIVLYYLRVELKRESLLRKKGPENRKRALNYSMIPPLKGSIMQLRFFWKKKRHGSNLAQDIITCSRSIMALSHLSLLSITKYLWSNSRIFKNPLRMMIMMEELVPFLTSKMKVISYMEKENLILPWKSIIKHSIFWPPFPRL